MIVSTPAMVDNRCAIMIVVRPTISLSSPACTARSALVSRAEVASSRMSSGASFSIARATATRWRCPPDRRRPRSPMTVSYPSVNFMMKSWALARLATSTTSSSVASGLP